MSNWIPESISVIRFWDDLLAFLELEVLYDEVHFFNPVVDEADISLLFFLGEGNLTAVGLHEDVVLILPLAPHLNCRLGHLGYLAVGGQGY